MTFTNEQIEQLQAPLDKAHVLEREAYKGGPKLSYVEGWHVIAEANRIFGHGEWSRELVRLERVSTSPYVKAGWNGKPDTDMVEIGYMATVRVTVGNVTREGTGFGIGQSKAEIPAAAHESAAKEAETDAMKRALMTFGNPFGLALYDKKKANVEDYSNTKKPESSAEKIASKSNARQIYSGLSASLHKLESIDAIDRWEDLQKVIDARKTLPPDWAKTLGDEVIALRHSIFNKQAAA